METRKSILLMMSGVMAFAFSSCKNADRTFPDNEGGTSVYFAYQYPVRTLVLGNDEVVDNSRDNEHKCAIYATMGGSYEGRDITIDVEIDNSLCDNLTFEDGSPVLPLPADYYEMLGNQIRFGGDHWGYVEIQLKDAFFADPKALTNNYVIPVLMTRQKGADRIITGEPLIDGDQPARTNSAYWNIQPKDYVLYCVKYMNPWHGFYLRRGIDQITTADGTITTNVRHEESVEKDEVCEMTSRSLNTAIFPVSIDDENGTAVTCDLLLTFDGDNCTITSGSDGIVASGSGKFVEDGEKNSWGNKDRDVIYLDYSIDYGFKQVATKDTLVAQTRGTNKLVTFTPTYNEK